MDKFANRWDIDDIYRLVISHCIPFDWQGMEDDVTSRERLGLRKEAEDIPPGVDDNIFFSNCKK